MWSLVGGLLLIVVMGYLAMSIDITVTGVGLDFSRKPNRKQIAARKKREYLDTMQKEGEPFVAFCLCPRCEVLDHHWIKTYVGGWSRIMRRVHINTQRECRACGFNWRQF